jgi:hypothetical protein
MPKIILTLHQDVENYFNPKPMCLKNILVPSQNAQAKLGFGLGLNLLA